MKIVRVSKRNGYVWVEGREEGETKNTENGRKKGWGRRDRVKSNNMRRSLGAEWEISDVGIPTPHISENPHTLVESITNKNNNTFGLKCCADMKYSLLSDLFRQANINTENQLMDLSDSS